MRSPKTSWSWAAVPICVWGAFLGCGAEPPNGDETDLVLTIENESADFSAQQSFFVVSEVVELCAQPNEPNGSDPGKAPMCAELSREQDEALLEHTVSELEARGHTRVEELDDADWVLVIGLVARPLWDLGERSCFEHDEISGCTAPLTDEDIQIPTGSVMIYLLDAETSDANLWTSDWVAAVDERFTSGGPIGLGGAPSEALVETWLGGISQAFEQSPELGEAQ